jgi:HAD superfamily hydrolase (TIGR01509 family)
MTEPWYLADAQRALAALFGGPAALEPAEVNWDRRAVCRVTLPGGARGFAKIDRDEVRHRREAAALRAARSSGAPVPEVLGSLHGDPCLLVLRELPTRQSLRGGPALWREAGAAARDLHRTPIPAGLGMFCDGGSSWDEHVTRRIELEATLAVRRGLLNRFEADATIRYAEGALCAAGTFEPVLLHGDLQARHVMVVGDEVVLVDFGDAGFGDPVFDLVVLTHLDPAQRDDVLEGYCAGAALRERMHILGATYSLWRNLFVSRWYFENGFEQRRNSEAARRALQEHVLPSQKRQPAAQPPRRIEADAVLLDFDGLIVDTEFAGFRSWCELFAEHGRELSILEYAASCGHDSPHSPWEELERAAGRELDRELLELQRRERHASMMRVLPGVRDFLERCRSSGLRLAIVSNSPIEWIQRHMTASGLEPSDFEFILSGEGHPPKPAPDAYQIALSRLGVSPERAVAFEDSARGVTAARAAGLFSVAVPNRVTVHNDFGHADLLVDGLSCVEVVPSADRQERTATC